MPEGRKTSVNGYEVLGGIHKGIVRKGRGL